MSAFLKAVIEQGHILSPYVPHPNSMPLLHGYRVYFAYGFEYT